MRSSGETVGVKDLYAVYSERIGAGNPTWEAHAAREVACATAVAALRAAGATITGITRTDEFAYSLAGTNAHFGTPPNPRAPGRISGGSSSGSVSAVALGHVTIGLGTDTGGSIRVPAAYNGVWGIRTTHGAVDRGGLLPLAPSFDTVGWFTRTPELLARVGDMLLPPGTGAFAPLGPLVVVPELLALADPDVAAAVDARARELGAVEESWDLADLPAWRAAFTTWQAWEAWQAHGAWLADRLDTLGADVRGRFEMASRVTEEQARAAYAVVLAARARDPRPRRQPRGRPAVGLVGRARSSAATSTASARPPSSSPAWPASAACPPSTCPSRRPTACPPASASSRPPAATATCSPWSTWRPGARVSPTDALPRRHARGLRVPNPREGPCGSRSSTRCRTPRRAPD